MRNNSGPRRRRGRPAASPQVFNHRVIAATLGPPAPKRFWSVCLSFRAPQVRCRNRSRRTRCSQSGLGRPGWLRVRLVWSFRPRSPARRYRSCHLYAVCREILNRRHSCLTGTSFLRSWRTTSNRCTTLLICFQGIRPHSVSDVVSTMCQRCGESVPVPSAAGQS